MSSLYTGYEEIDRNWRCRACPGTTRRVFHIVQNAAGRCGCDTGTVPAATMQAVMWPEVEREVRASFSIIWLYIALTIAKIILQIWINKHSMEA